MASERDRRRVDSTPMWDQVKASFSGGYDNEQAQQKSAQPENSAAMLEALRKRRAQSMGS